MDCNQSCPTKKKRYPRQYKLICIVQLLTRGLRCVGRGIFREPETGSGDRKGDNGNRKSKRAGCGRVAWSRQNRTRDKHVM